MHRFSENDINIISVLEKNGVRAKNPIAIIKLLDNSFKYHSMNRDETIKSLEFLEEIGYIEVNNSFISLTEYFDNQMYLAKRETMANNYTLEQKRAARFKMLEKFYLESGGSEQEWLNIHEVGEELRFPNDLNEITHQYLASEGLIEFKAMGGIAGITHYGVTQYESAISSPETESIYFPPVSIINNILKIDNINNSQVQVGSNDSSQNMYKGEEYEEIIKWVDNLEKLFIDKKMNNELDSIRDEIDIIKATIKSEKPNRKYLNIALDTIKNLLIGISSNAIFQRLVETMPKIIP